MDNQLNMGPEFIWKNFHLGTELEIAGNFIFDALYSFDQMKHFYYESEIFECLYHLSVGIERLQKITLILLTDFKNEVDGDFEKKLINHNTQYFHQRINSIHKIPFGKNENKLLKLLANFYSKNRYGRFNFNSSLNSYYEKIEFISFVNGLIKGLDIQTSPLESTKNEENIKKEFGNVINKVVSSYYKIIENICRDQNIYTYEINSDSKAFYIFSANNFDFIHYNHVKREVLYFLMNNSQDILNNKKKDFTDFDIETKTELISFLVNKCKDTHMIDSYECILAEEILENENINEVIENRKFHLEFLFEN